MLWMTFIAACIVTLANAFSPAHYLQRRCIASSTLLEVTRNRRQFLAVAIGSTFSSISIVTSAPHEVSASDTALTDVYFGTGCFWHIQHEFVEAERKRLKRNYDEATSRAGYAGGKTTDREGRVCYHNLQGVADYGKLGHGEVVGLRIPESSVVEFAEDYFNMFAPNGERVDPMDRGGEYRALIGLPEGMQNPAFPRIRDVAARKGMKLIQGVGNDPDTYGTKTALVYDSIKFPFFQAEVYHQFHNDFQSPPYGKEYNNLAMKAFEEGRLTTTGCPDRV